MYIYTYVHIHMDIPERLSLLMTKTSKSTSSERDIRPVWILKFFLFILISVILKIKLFIITALIASYFYHLICFGGEVIMLIDSSRQCLLLAKERIHIQIFEHM
jgi:hypothetical protein